MIGALQAKFKQRKSCLSSYEVNVRIIPLADLTRIYVRRKSSHAAVLQPWSRLSARAGGSRLSYVGPATTLLCTGCLLKDLARRAPLFHAALSQVFGVLLRPREVKHCRLAWWPVWSVQSWPIPAASLWKRSSNCMLGSAHLHLLHRTCVCQIVSVPGMNLHSSGSGPAGALRVACDGIGCLSGTW